VALITSVGDSKHQIQKEFAKSFFSLSIDAYLGHLKVGQAIPPDHNYRRTSIWKKQLLAPQSPNGFGLLLLLDWLGMSME
jgi:hypothetical protein